MDSMPRHLRFRVHAALLFVQITFAGFSVIGKYVLHYLPPLALAGFRVLVVAPSLLAISLLRDRRTPPAKELPRLALLGLLGVCINQVLFVVGLSHTTAVNTAILMPSIPVFTLSVAAALRLERLSVRGVTGVLLAVAGALIMLDVTDFSFESEAMFGNLLILLNCLSYAVFLVLARPVLLRLPPLMVIAWSYLFGGIGVLAISATTLTATDYSAIPSAVWLGVAYIVLLATLINYILNTWAIRQSSSSLVATYTTLQTLIAGVLAVVFLKESVGWTQLGGSLLIISGLLVVTRKPPSSDSRFSSPVPPRS
jgi:drug/metabolite transporter (DMT)-like permease